MKNNKKWQLAGEGQEELFQQLGDTVHPDDIDEPRLTDEELLNEDIPLIDKVAHILSMIRNDTCIDVVGSIEYDYTARDIIKYVRPLLNDEQVMYDVFHNADNDYLSILRIY